MKSTLILTCLALSSAMCNAASSAPAACSKSEITVWSCQAKGKTYLICASREATKTTGYMQYRAGTPTKTEFIYPSGLRHPKGIFTFEPSMLDPSLLTFVNDDYEYIITEPRMDVPFIDVRKNKRTLSHITCNRMGPSITGNQSLDIFRAFDIYDQ